MGRSFVGLGAVLGMIAGASLPSAGQPMAIRCDNGPELTSRHFRAWCVERQIELVHIQPGKPTQNAHVESFHGRLREERLAVSWFQNLFDARRKIAAWRIEYVCRQSRAGDCCSIYSFYETNVAATKSKLVAK